MKTSQESEADTVWGRNAAKEIPAPYLEDAK